MLRFLSDFVFKINFFNLQASLLHKDTFRHAKQSAIKKSGSRTISDSPFAYCFFENYFALKSNSSPQPLSKILFGKRTFVQVPQSPTSFAFALKPGFGVSS